MIEYWIGLVATVSFGMSGVLAVRHRDVDIVGAMVFGIVTAVGGGTIRDLILREPVFWCAEASYLWLILGGSLTAFIFRRVPRRAGQLLLYLDALGVALFSIHSMDRALNLEFSVGASVLMGLITGTGGGLIRDVLSGRTNLLLSKELYATPIVAGCLFYYALLEFNPNFEHNQLLAISAVFSLRSAAIWFEWMMPSFLISRAES